MRYTPRSLFGEFDLETVEHEFEKIKEVLDYLLDGYKEIWHVAPTHPEEGMLVIADGTDWNPGAGAGAYEYKGGTWVKL